MSKENNITAKNAAEGLRILWKERFFRTWRTLRAISATLEQRGNNFPKAVLGTALLRANYLTRRGKRGAFEYAQKRPAESKVTKNTEQNPFIDYDLHRRVKEVVGTKYQSDHYAEAVESAFKEVIKRVKDFVNTNTGKRFDGAKAMGRAFDFEKQQPLIKFNNLESDEEKDEQRGISFLFKGVVFIRNRKAHENITLDNPHRAREYLAIASLLMRLLDEHAK